SLIIVLAHRLALTDRWPKTHMRELFDEASGRSPLDPEEAARRTTRGPRRKRFYAHVRLVEDPDGFAITLDDKPVRPPSGRALVAREAAHWDPIVFWAADALGAHFILAEGIVHVRQPDSAIAAARAALPTDPWSIAALHVVTTLTGSALLALALMRSVIDQDQAWAAAHVDE